MNTTTETALKCSAIPGCVHYLKETYVHVGSLAHSVGSTVMRTQHSSDIDEIMLHTCVGVEILATVCTES